jgi:hypothetical protein
MILTCNGIRLRAITCPRCKCKIYPSNLLPGHLTRHKDLDAEHFYISKYLRNFIEGHHTSREETL